MAIGIELTSDSDADPDCESDELRWRQLWPNPDERNGRLGNLREGGNVPRIMPPVSLCERRSEIPHFWPV
jgi:hypothetical protein